MRMVRKVIRIDESKCDGCGLCESACHEGAIRIIDGKARLVTESYCDGLGACLGECPQGAITLEEREADAFVEPPPAKAPPPRPAMSVVPHSHGGHACPGSAMRSMNSPKAASDATVVAGDQPPASSLGHWPVQLMLVPPFAPFLAGADLIVCADCVPFAVPDFHARYLSGKAVVVGCPKLDDLEHYREKLHHMFAASRPERITVVRMDVPCCGGIAHATIEARNASAPDCPLEVHTVGIGGGIRREVVPPAA